MRRNDRGQVAGLLIVAGAVVIGLLLMLGLYLGGMIFSQKTANIRGETAKRNLVEGNGSFRIAAYNYFFDLCTTIQGNEATATQQRALLAQTPKSDQADRQRILTNIAVIESSRATNIAQYNNDAKKSYTSAQFRSSALPFRLDPTAKETTCAL